MCGRFAQIEPIDMLARRLHVDEVLVHNKVPRYNIYPGEDIVVLVHTCKKELVEYKWGLIPYWVNDITKAKGFINARAETIAAKPSFKKAFIHNRCIILASGFYEWKKEGTKKIPYYITTKDLFGFAGIFDSVNVSGKALYTCAILTVQANEAMRAIHNRMPLIMRYNVFDSWIAHETDIQSLEELIKPFDGELSMYPVTIKVNNPSYQGADCITPLV